MPIVNTKDRQAGLVLKGGPEVRLSPEPGALRQPTTPFMLRCNITAVAPEEREAISLCSAANGTTTMAKTATLTPAARLPELKLARLDLGTLFASQKANLASVQEAQRVLIEALQAIARVQYGYVERTMADARAVLERKELVKPEAALANTKTASEKAVAVTKEVLDLAAAAQRRVSELATQRAQANVAELKALAA